MATADRFTCSAVWSESDQEWVGLRGGFGEAMTWMAPDRQAALDGIQAVVGEFVELLDEQGLPHPTPTVAHSPDPVEKSPVVVAGDRAGRLSNASVFR
ncbi:MAG: hypothetical protein F4110_08535 [Acidimicrobiaceae bacterium]|nr:hypothetical protein [Acidimicrobiaceae bacterium]MYE98130.1 hypothetical protein [Acidimicrobiaceae bacterium]MYH43223.1 hypothetical protein [Acidimicrobiaceae bacterium]MYI54009.1 hypothetical protein [Acidimicrobiaceae bacterium]MYJ81413.1 hypothetical protein [Acidimicrobiaceae bacterium]